MGIFFSKKKHSRITQQDEAVLKLKQTRDKIKQYQRRIEQSIEKERLLAKKLVQNGQKERALLLLRKKRFQEQVLSKTDGQLENLERMVHDIEFAQVELKVIEGLKLGNTTLKKLNDLLSVDEIEKVLDETREGVEKQKEINDILSGELTAEDEDEVEAEFDAMVEAELKEAIPEVPYKEVPLPEIPDEMPLPNVPQEVPLPNLPEEVPLPNVPEEEPEKKRERVKNKTQEAVALEA